MFIKPVSSCSLKENILKRAQSVGSFCGRKVEILKVNTSALIAKGQLVASKALHFISSTFRGIKKTFTAVSNFLSTKVTTFLSLKAVQGNRSEAGINVNDVLASGPISEKYDRGKAVVDAAEKGHLNIIEDLLANGADISEEHRRDAVSRALMQGHINLLQILVPNDPIYEGLRGTLVERLAGNGRLDIIEVLLANGATISKEHRGEAVANAAGSGHLNIIQTLLANGATISKEHSGKAVANAAGSGHLNIIEVLLANGATISKEHRGEAVANAAGSGHLNIIQTLLANGATISKEHIGKAVANAAGSGHLNIIQTLLANGATISEEHSGKAVANAARSGHLNIIQTLLANGATISEEKRGYAVISAAYSGHLNIIQALLANGATISEEHRGVAVHNATTQNHAAIIEALLANGATISDKDRINALWAISPKTPDLLPLLANTDALRKCFLTPPRPQAPQLHVDKEDLNLNPMRYLDLIVERGFPSRVFFQKSKGSDGGGLRKEFVSCLVQSLQPHLSLIEAQLPLIELEDPNADAKKEILRKFGVFLSDLYVANLNIYVPNVKKSDDPCLIGQLFHPRFFDIVKLILDNQPEDQTLKSLARILQEINPRLSSLTKVILAPDDAAAKETFASYFGFNLDTDNIAKEAKKMLLGYLEGPRALISGLTPQLKSFIQMQPLQEICTVLQGQEATAESLIRALNLEEIDTSAEAADLFENQKRWLIEKIMSSDLAWRKSFIKWATGRTSLPPGTSIILKSMEIRGLQASTCSNTIVFPLEARSKEAFLAALDDLKSDLQYDMA